MRQIVTTPIRCLDVHWLALCAVFMPACLLPPGVEATTDVALDTGAQTSQSSQGESSTADDSDDKDSDAADTSESAAQSDDSGAHDTSSSTGEPPDELDTTSSDSDPDEPCGNGALDPGEACDGELLVPATCLELDPVYSEGAPTCDATCQLDTSACIACEAPTLAPCDDDSDDPFHALELGCSDLENWNAKNAVKLASHKIAPDPSTYRAIRRFGTHESAWTPRAGHRALLISTGKVNPPDPEGIVTAKPGSAQNGGGNGNPASVGALPAGLAVNLSDGGSAPFTDCDGLGDCSNTLWSQWDSLPNHVAEDVFYLELETVVPPGTHGYALDLAFFTAHFPEYNSAYKEYNDMVVLWSQSEAYVGNITYLRQASEYGDKYEPLSLPALVKAGLMVHDGLGASELAGTGFDAPSAPAQGGATDWLTVEGPAVPGETLLLALAVMDLDDNAIDSAVLLDNFRWTCGGCDLTADCGVRVADGL